MPAPRRSVTIPAHGQRHCDTAPAPRCRSTHARWTTGIALILDTTVYIDTLKATIGADILYLIATKPIWHAAPALAELSLAIGLLDPADPRTAASTQVIRETLRRVPTPRMLAPAPDLWVQAAILTGILARTQGIPKADRRKLLNESLLFLMAERLGAALLTRNVHDFDLLLQINPEPAVLFYDQN